MTFVLFATILKVYSKLKGAFPETLKVVAVASILNFTLNFQAPRAENRNIWFQK